MPEGAAHIRALNGARAMPAISAGSQHWWYWAISSQAPVSRIGNAWLHPAEKSHEVRDTKLRSSHTSSNST